MIFKMLYCLCMCVRVRVLLTCQAWPLRSSPCAERCVCAGSTSLWRLRGRWLPSAAGWCLYSILLQPKQTHTHRLCFIPVKKIFENFYKLIEGTRWNVGMSWDLRRQEAAMGPFVQPFLPWFGSTLTVCRLFFLICSTSHPQGSRPQSVV